MEGTEAIAYFFEYGGARRDHARCWIEADGLEMALCAGHTEDDVTQVGRIGDPIFSRRRAHGADGIAVVTAHRGRMRDDIPAIREPHADQHDTAIIRRVSGHRVSLPGSHRAEGVHPASCECAASSCPCRAYTRPVAYPNTARATLPQSPARTAGYSQIQTPLTSVA